MSWSGCCTGRRMAAREQQAVVQRSTAAVTWVAEAPTPVLQTRISASRSLLVDLGPPTFLGRLLVGGVVRRLADLELDTLARAQNLALQVEAASLLGVVGVVQALEALHHVLHVGLAALRRRDVEDLARLVQCQPRRRRGARAAGRVARAAPLPRRRRGLLVSFGECAAKDAGAGENDLGDDPVRLATRSAPVRSGRGSAQPTHHPRLAKSCDDVLQVDGKQSASAASYWKSFLEPGVGSAKRRPGTFPARANSARLAAEAAHMSSSRRRWRSTTMLHHSLHSSA